MRTLFLSVTLTSCWLFSSCTPLEGTEPSPWNDGIEKADRNHIYYPNTRRPYDWDWFTIKPKERTEWPRKYDHPEENSFGKINIVLFVVIPIIGLFLLGIIIKFMCAQCEDSDSESVTIHQPPTRFIAPPSRTVPTFQNNYASVNASRSNYPAPGFRSDYTPVDASRSNYPAPGFRSDYVPVDTSRSNYAAPGFRSDFLPANNDGVSSMSNAVDKPPEYFDVVRTDNIATFPETTGKLNEIPPPKYEEDTHRY